MEFPAEMMEINLFDGAVTFADLSEFYGPGRHVVLSLFGPVMT